MKLTLAILTLLVLAGCGSSPVSPSLVRTIHGASILTDSVSSNACITSLRDVSRHNPNQLTGTIAGATLTLSDQFGATYVWQGTVDGSVYTLSTTFPDPYSGPCGVHEHVVRSMLTLVQVGSRFTGIQVNEYRLMETGEAVTDTLAWDLTGV